jgi:hypothetical protein
MFGVDYFFNQVGSPENNDPFFHGGEMFAAYICSRRLVFVYGYGMLDRFGLNGYTQFFQTRVQLQL